jgi:transcriptional regulator with XRE-family HTH domain
MDNKINQLCKALNLSQVEFGEKLGVTQSSISQIKSKNKISSRMIATICAVFPQVNKVWLTTGKGEMFVTSPGEEASIVKEDHQPYSKYGAEIDDMIRILVEIMQSSNTTVKEALKQNLIAFQFAIHAGKERDDLKTIVNPSDGITTAKKG